ncbi:MAG: dihydrofolate reductase [Bacteroidaceae bacterium]|nr:dihydrofolate reductase [Bacteroidaceae bacterium]
MDKFRKLVAIEPISLIPSAEQMLSSYADEVIMYSDIPESDDVIAERIGNADAVLLSYTSTITGEILSRCHNVRYIGMCCSLYSPESANVDIKYANEHGICVTGIRDYGDEGVVEYVVSELVRCLHGFGQEPWEGMPREITGLKVGIVGLGKSGGMIADAMKFFGAEISYFARSEKEEAKAKGYTFRPLTELMEWSEVVFCCLNKNTVLLHEAEFKRFGNHKILFNTGLSPAWDEKPLEEWLQEDNLLYCDTLGALGNAQLLNNKNVKCANVSTGRTRQAFDRLSEKVLANIKNFCDK